MSLVPVQAPVQPEAVAPFVPETTPHVTEEYLCIEEAEYIFSYCFIWRIKIC